MTNNPIKTHTKNRVNCGGVKRRIAFIGAWDYDEPVNRSEYPVAVNGKYYRSPDNQPSAYAELSEAEQDALQEWIGLCMRPAKTTGPGTSYGIKHDFEEVGFHVSNGSFKGAILVAGYEPVDWTALNWEFRAKPTNRPKRDGYGRRGTGNVLYYDLPEEAEGRKRLTALVDKALGKAVA